MAETEFGRIATGTCAMYFVEDGVYELAKMAVDKNYQGQGLSHLLMKACEDWAIKNKAKRIVLYSNTSLKPALKLYKKHGYNELFLVDILITKDRTSAWRSDFLSKSLVKLVSPTLIRKIDLAS